MGKISYQNGQIQREDWSGVFFWGGLGPWGHLVIHVLEMQANVEIRFVISTVTIRYGSRGDGPTGGTGVTDNMLQQV